MYKFLGNISGEFMNKFLEKIHSKNPRHALEEMLGVLLPCKAFWEILGDISDEIFKGISQGFSRGIPQKIAMRTSLENFLQESLKDCMKKFFK